MKNWTVLAVVAVVAFHLESGSKYGPFAAAPPTADPGKVEVSEGKVTVGGNGKELNCEVKYRFTEGKPVPGMWYTCHADFSTGVGVFFTLDGKEMKAEGTLKNTFAAFKAPGKTCKITFMAGRQKGAYRKISNELMVN